MNDREGVGTATVAFVIAFTARMFGTLHRDIWDQICLVSSGIVAAAGPRVMTEEDRGRLWFFYGSLAVMSGCGGYLTATVGGQVGATAAAVIGVSIYYATRTPPDDRRMIIDAIEGAVHRVTRAEPADFPHGLVTDTEWDGEPNVQRGFSAAVVHWGRGYQTGAQRNLDKLHQELESALGGVALNFAAETDKGRARITIKPPDKTETDRKITWPLVKAPKLDLWEPIPIGFDERGKTVKIGLFQHNVLVAGVMGYGKSIALQMFASAVALDPGAAQDFMDGKLIEMRRWSYLARRCVTVTPAGDVDVRGGIALLDDLLADVQERRLFLDRKGEQKIRKEHGIPLRLTIIDELAEFLDDREYGPEFARKLKSVIRLSRALGLPVAAGIVRPSAATFTTDVRDLFDIRMSFKQMTNESRKMALGRTTDVDEPTRPGVCWLLDERSDLRKIRTFFLTGPQMTAIADRGMRLRGQQPKEVRAEVDREFERLLGLESQAQPPAPPAPPGPSSFTRPPQPTPASRPATPEPTEPTADTQTRGAQRRVRRTGGQP